MSSLNTFRLPAVPFFTDAPNIVAAAGDAGATAATVVIAAADLAVAVPLVPISWLVFWASYEGRNRHDPVTVVVVVGDVCGNNIGA